MKTTIKTDLFGQTKVKVKLTFLEKALQNYDKTTFEDRLKRFELIQKIYPDGLLIGGEMEFAYTFGEVKECYIAGHFIATILLAQCFIEKVFHSFFVRKGLDTEAKKGLAEMIKYAKRHHLINHFVLKKVDGLRLKRNPFTHTKDWNHPHTMSKRMYDGNKVTLPQDLLAKDATEAVQLMFFLTTHNL
jgi:hypothetical protein